MAEEDLTQTAESVEDQVEVEVAIPEKKNLLTLMQEWPLSRKLSLAAVTVITLALFAVITTWITGNPIFDAIGSIGIGVLLILIAIFIGIEVKALLIGQGVEPKTREKMLSFLQSRPEIEKIFNLLTLQMGNDVMVAIKAKMVTQQSADELITAINTCEVAFKQKFPETMWLFFEPDNQD